MSGFQGDAGMLRHRVRLEQAVTTPDMLGGVTTLWQQVTEVWGYVELIAGSEIQQADALRSVIWKRLILRNTSEVDASMRCVVYDQIYEIAWVAPHKQYRAFLECRIYGRGEQP